MTPPSARASWAPARPRRRARAPRERLARERQRPPLRRGPAVVCKCDGRSTRPPRCVVVPPEARPGGLALLLGDIERGEPPGGLDVRVYDDATPNPDEALERRVRERGWTCRRAAAN